MNACRACGFANAPGMKFCGECGTRLVVAPPEMPSHLSARLPAEAAALEAGPSTEGERKTITALFADIKGSMELMEDLDPEEARRIVDPALQRMIDAVHRYEGYVAQSTGDGIFALFGAPIAQEDHAQRAIYAALRIQEEIERYADLLRQEKGITFQVRVGLNSGEVVLRSIQKDDRHADYVPVGHSTGLAARMQNLAPAGGIVVSEATYRLTEGYFAFKSLGPARIKGVSEPVEVYEVAGIGAIRTRLQRAARRGLTRFVGRQPELRTVRDVLARARQGSGQIVAVSGEAGVGKSRLTLEIKATAADDWLVLETAAVSFGKAYPYLPVIELLKQYCGITADDDERRRREKVTGKLLTLDRELEDAMPFIFTLLGLPVSTGSGAVQMDPQIVRRRTLDALARLFLREGRNQPVLLIIEDLHWLDNESQAFLDVLSARLSEVRLCLLVNYRPEYHPSWNGTRVTEIRLNPLRREDAADLLAALLGHAPELEEVQQLILEKTGGNPFFLEELVHSLVDEGVLERTPLGFAGAACRLRKPITQIHIPASVQGVLAARIDRLAPDDRALLQTMAVIGKRFSLGLVEQVAHESARDLRGALARLRAADFIHEEAALPEPEYTFKHVLTQEVAYGSQLSDRRRTLHERTARALEASNVRDEQAAELAHHYTLSGNAAKAVQYLQLAAQQALQHSAHNEAVQHLSTALPLLATLPETDERNEQELMLQVTLGRALMLARGWADPSTERVFARARELCERSGGSFNLLVALGMLYGFYVARSDFLAAQDLAKRLMGFAESSQFPGLLRVAHYVTGQVSLYLGDFVAALDHLNRGAALESADEELLYTSFGVEDLRVGTATLKALVLWHLGYPDQALQQSEIALTDARRLLHAFTLAGALLTAAQVRVLRGEGTAGQALAEALVAQSIEHGLQHEALGRIVAGVAIVQQGQLDDGIARMREGLERLRIKGATFSAPALARLAEALGRTGHIREAFDTLSQALERVTRTRERNSESLLHQIRGELLLLEAPGDAANEAAAEACFQHALAVGREQAAKSLELAAATSLARLWQRQGRRAEARQLLKGIYGWFTEGFDTADLRAARHLLDEL